MPYQGMLKILTCCWISIIIVTSSPAVSSQLVAVTSDISPGDILCPGEKVNFTCTTRDTGILAWTSDEYIGNGNRLELSSGDGFDVIRQSSIDSNTTAILVNRSVENDNILVLVSQLRITVSSISLNPSVTCVRNRDNLQDVFSFQVLATPAVPQVIAEYPMGPCELNISITAPDNIAINDISHFVIDIDGMNMVPTNVNDGTSLSFVRNVSSCATRNVSVVAVDRCGRQSSPAVDTADPGQDCVCDSERVNVHVSVNNTPAIVGGAVGGAALLILVIVVVIVIIVVIRVHKNKKTKVDQIRDKKI